MLVICAGLPRSNSLQMFNWMIHIAESHRDCHFYNARYVDFYDDPAYAIGDHHDRFSRVLDLLRERYLTHVLMKTHACPRNSIDLAAERATVTTVFTLRNIGAAIESLLHLWCNFDLPDHTIVEKCLYQIQMNLRSLSQIHDRSHILLFDDMLADRRATVLKVAGWMQIPLSDPAVDWILTRTSRENLQATYEQMPHMWWETYHDMMNVHLTKDERRFITLAQHIPNMLERLQPELRAVQRTTGLDLHTI